LTSNVQRDILSTALPDFCDYCKLKGPNCERGICQIQTAPEVGSTAAPQMIQGPRYFVDVWKDLLMCRRQTLIMELGSIEDALGMDRSIPKRR